MIFNKLTLVVTNLIALKGGKEAFPEVILKAYIFLSLT